MKIEMLTTVVNDSQHIMNRDVPVSSTIIELSDHSLAIVDTGSPGNPDLAEQLGELGYAPADFTLVLNTHLHLDHIGGNRLFKNARIIISRQEFEYENVLSILLQESEDPVDLLRSLGRNIASGTESLAWDMKSLYEEYPTALLLGDERQIEYYEDHPKLPNYITNMEVPGHSIGSRAIMLHGKRRNVMISGDALYHRDLWRQDLLAGLHYDEDLFRRNAEHLSRFSDIIIPGHDRGFDNMTQQYLKNDYLQM
jgi:glyoxylase-like metal-dependent hydrolase (beta-lactamase superfamily II)